MVKALPVFAVSSKRTEAHRIAVQRFFPTELFRRHLILKDWVHRKLAVLEINSDFFNDALHKALLKRVYEKRLSGSAPNRLEAHEADCNLPKRVGYTQLQGFDSRFF